MHGNNKFGIRSGTGGVCSADMYVTVAQVTATAYGNDGRASYVVCIVVGMFNDV